VVGGAGKARARQPVVSCIGLCLRGACGPDTDGPGLPKLLLLLLPELIQLREWLLPVLLPVLLHVLLPVLRACMQVSASKYRQGQEVDAAGPTALEVASVDAA
jgi:hypothetical protein